MHRAWRLCLLWLGLSCGEVAAQGGERLVVATYNLQNYGPADRVIEAGFRKDYPKPEASKAALREVIRGLGADVVALQEMGPASYLEELRRDLRAEGTDYPHTALCSAADSDRHIAIISREPLRAIVTHTDLSFAYFGGKEVVKRGMLEATIKTASGDVTLFAVHLKSRITERPDDPLCAIRRAGEAVAIRDRILQRFPEPATGRFILLGDCNDGRNARPLAALQRRGKTDIVTLLSATDSRGEVWTHAYRRDDTYSRVDHILVSPALMQYVVRQHAIIYDASSVRSASDHRPVVATLEFPAPINGP